MQIRKAHDKFIRDLMSRKEAVRDFLHYYLDQELVELLDLSTLEIKKDTFVDQELVEHFSDILYQLEFRNGQNAQVYVLIEHKSYSDSLVAFQLLRYMIRIWELELNQQSKSRKGKRQQKKKEEKKGDWIQGELEFRTSKQEQPQEETPKSEPQSKLALTPILPIIFYHGTQEWKVPLGFQDIFLDLPSLLTPYVPNFRYFLYDLTTIKDSEIQGDLILQIGLLSLKYARDDNLKDKLKQIFELIDQLGDPQTVREYLETVVRYLWSTNPINQEQLKTTLVETRGKEGDSIIMAIVQTYIEQGRAEVRQEMEQEIQKVRQEAQQQLQAKERQGLLSSIELGLELKFGKEGLGLFNEVQQIQEMSLLSAIRAALKFVRDLGELRSIYQPPLASN